MTSDSVVEAVRTAFAATPHPGDPFLQGSFEGDEPFDEVGAFHGVTRWQGLEPAFLDQHYSALSFFSEGGLRFFLPAYMVADLHDALQTADPLFGLIHGFSTMQVEYPGADGITRPHRSGGSVLLGPRRYGAMSWEDASRHRLSVFCREEATAIVAYLEWRRAHDELGLDAPRIDSALATFWRGRAAAAPTRLDLEAFGRD